MRKSLFQLIIQWYIWKRIITLFVAFTTRDLVVGTRAVDRLSRFGKYWQDLSIFRSIVSGFFFLLVTFF